MDIQEIPHAYRAARRRLLLLDYDGTLAPIVALPEQAAPSKHVTKLLASFTSDPATTCVVISGRAAKDLEKWLGRLSLAFVAEHGFMWRTKDGTWSPHVKTTTEWKIGVRLLMEKYVKFLPGSFIEEKTAAIAFHYRKAAHADKETYLQNLLRQLKAYSQNETPVLQVMEGKEVYEVMSSVSSKGESALEWYYKEPWDFVMAIGDDITDESMFKALSDKSMVFTIKVGSGVTTAKYRIESQKEVIELLNSLDSP